MKMHDLTLSQLYGKLRHYNYRNYLLITFCLMLSVLLIGSYTMIYFSPTVQRILPEGGDSRKMASMIFAAALIGCGIFTIYASSLFFKCKSREIGIFLALGAKRRKLASVLFQDICTVCIIGCGLGLLFATPAAIGIWKLFQIFIIDTRDMKYQFSPAGLFIAVGFALLMCICIFFMALLFLNRSNIIDILNDQKKSEPIKLVKSWYGAAGAMLTVAGLVIGYGISGFSMNVLHYRLPSIFNAIYLLSVLGVYMLMVYFVIHAKRGNHPEKYYKNIISISMMRFMGRQTVKNMCVIVLLIFGSLFALFYLPMTLLGSQETAKTTKTDFRFAYPETTTQISKPEIETLADQYKIQIKNYQETSSVQLFIDGIQENYNDDNTITSEYKKQLTGAYFFNASDFSRMTGMECKVKKGSVTLLSEKNVSHNTLLNEDQKILITNPVTKKEQNFPVADTIPYENGLYHGQFNTYYLMNEEDYQIYEKQLSASFRTRMVSFNVNNWKETYSFASALKNEIIQRSPAESAVWIGHNNLEKELEIAENGSYFVDKRYPAGQNVLTLSPDNAMLYLNWKYYPDFKVLLSQDAMKNIAVFVMLFLFVALICLAAVGIISYTRGISIAINYKQVFIDLIRLGANHTYLRFCIKSQLRKIFFLPALTGSILIFLYTILIYWQNNGKFDPVEIHTIGINIIMMAVVFLYLYVIYQITFRKFEIEIGISS